MQPQSFIHSLHFERAWARLGLTDEDLFELQTVLMIDPEAGQVIRRSGGLRKLRIALPGRGKRGGARIIYLHYFAHSAIALLDAFAKNVKEDVDKQRLRTLMETAQQIRKELQR